MTSDIAEMKCPLCSKPLATDEYGKAISELKQKLQENFDEQNFEQKEEYDLRIEELEKNHKRALEDNHLLHEHQLKQLQNELEKSYKTQADIIQKNYDHILKQNEKQFIDLEKQLKNNHKKEISEKSKQIQLLQKEQKNYKKMAIDEARETFASKERSLEQNLQQKDIQIQRFANEIETLKKQIQASQSELKGEAGELDLYAALTEAFPTDHFRRQTRGISSGDLVQQIRTANSTLDVPIVYDNKSANQVSKKDIEKAQKYQKIHGTNYVLIVSANLPKNAAPNGMYGSKDGIILVHPSLVVEVAKQIRTAIMEIARLSKSKQDRNGKESKLYEYVISQEFSLLLEKIARTNEKLFLLQSKEEKDHQVLWNTRKDLVDFLVKSYNDVSSGIESIIGTGLTELVQEAEI